MSISLQPLKGPFCFAPAICISLVNRCHTPLAKVKAPKLIYIIVSISHTWLWPTHSACARLASLSTRIQRTLMASQVAIKVAKLGSERPSFLRSGPSSVCWKCLTRWPPTQMGKDMVSFSEVALVLQSRDVHMAPATPGKLAAFWSGVWWLVGLWASHFSSTFSIYNKWTWQKHLRLTTKQLRSQLFGTKSKSGS